MRRPTATATASASSSSSGGSSAPGAEAVTARDTRRRLHRIPEPAQLVDVAADRARADLEPVGQLLAGPFAPHLQQGQQGEQSCGGLDHRDAEHLTNCGQDLTASPSN